MTQHCMYTFAQRGAQWDEHASGLACAEGAPGGELRPSQLVHRIACSALQIANLLQSGRFLRSLLLCTLLPGGGLSQQCPDATLSLV